MNSFMLDAFIYEDTWAVTLPDGEIWGGYTTFRELVQKVGEWISPDMQITVTHPDDDLAGVTILRGWRVS